MLVSAGVAVMMAGIGDDGGGDGVSVVGGFGKASVHVDEETMAFSTFFCCSIMLISRSAVPAAFTFDPRIFWYYL